MACHDPTVASLAKQAHTPPHVGERMYGPEVAALQIGATVQFSQRQCPMTGHCKRPVRNQVSRCPVVGSRH
jgi:hypothetical protein